MKKFTEGDYKTAHKFCIRNSEKLKKDKVCGCFYCLSVFAPSDITRWLKEKRSINVSNSDKAKVNVKIEFECEYAEEMTALCPFCEMDSVIGEGCGYPITREFLEEMNEFWFGGVNKTVSK